MVPARHAVDTLCKNPLRTPSTSSSTARVGTPSASNGVAPKDPAAVGVFAERRIPFTENSRAARFLLALNRVTDDAAFLVQAKATLRALAPTSIWTDEGRDIGDLLIAVEETAVGTVHATVVGRQSDASAATLLRAALKLRAPGLVVELSAPGEKYPDTGSSAVYVCTQAACSEPLTDPLSLRAALDRIMSAPR